MEKAAITVREETAAAVRRFALPVAAWCFFGGAISAAAGIGLLDRTSAAFAWAANAVFGTGLAAWALYRGFGLAARWIDAPVAAAAIPPRVVEPFAAAAPPREAKPRRKKSGPGLRTELRLAMQEGRARDALELRTRLARKLPGERLAKLDERLGGWLTKHFQRGLREGRAAELLPALESAAAAFAGHARFGYFAEILPTVRQAAELKAAAMADLDDDPPLPPVETNGHRK